MRKLFYAQQERDNRAHVLRTEERLSIRFTLLQSTYNKTEVCAARTGLRAHAGLFYGLTIKLGCDSWRGKGEREEAGKKREEERSRENIKFMQFNAQRASSCPSASTGSRFNDSVVRGTRDQLPPLSFSFSPVTSNILFNIILLGEIERISRARHAAANYILALNYIEYAHARVLLCVQ